MRVQSVGLGQQVERPGEVADLSRVDDRDVMPSVQERPCKVTLITAGGFDDDQTRAQGLQLRQQTLQTFIVGG